MANEAISLRDITRENVRHACRLKAKPGQLAFTVAPAISIAESHYFDEYWIQAIYLGETLAGIVMLSMERHRTIIERLFIDALLQHHGIGKSVVSILAQRFPVLLVKVVDLPGSPIEFWQKAGFIQTTETAKQHVVLEFHRSDR